MATAASSRPVVRDVPPTTERRSERRRWTVTATMWIGASFVAGSAVLHLHLWLAGYRGIPTIGPLFLGQAVAGFVLAAALAWTRSPTLAMVSAVFLAATIAGLLTSAWFGLFGFRDSFDAPYAVLSLFVEGTGVLVLSASVPIARAERRRTVHAIG
jgi:hypothetical protein